MGANFRCPPLVIGSKKVAELQKVSVKFASGDEQQVGPEGIIGFSDGVETLELTADIIQPVKNASVDFFSIIQGKRDIGIGVPINGKYVTSSFRCTDGNWDGDVKSGKFEGKFTFKNAAKIQSVG